AVVHLRSRRARPLLPRLRGADGTLADHPATGCDARRAVRGAGRRFRAAGAPLAGALRARLGRRMPRLPPDAATRAHCERHAGAPAALSDRGRPLAAIRGDAWTLAPRARAFDAWSSARIASSRATRVLGGASRSPSRMTWNRFARRTPSRDNHLQRALTRHA